LAIARGRVARQGEQNAVSDDAPIALMALPANLRPTIMDFRRGAKLAITPTHLTVGQLFEHNFIFRVPKFQRYYAWGEEQIEDFLKDLDVCVAKRRLGTQQHHFLGGIVTVSISPNSVRRDVEVIDGQQRLATYPAGRSKFDVYGAKNPMLASK
jgi:hypothetical protein